MAWGDRTQLGLNLEGRDGRVGGGGDSGESLGIAHSEISSPGALPVRSFAQGPLICCNIQDKGGFHDEIETVQ